MNDCALEALTRIIATIKAHDIESLQCDGKEDEHCDCLRLLVKKYSPLVEAAPTQSAVNQAARETPKGYDEAIRGIDYAMNWKNQEPDAVRFATGLAAARQFAIDARSQLAKLSAERDELHAALGEAIRIGHMQAKDADRVWVAMGMLGEQHSIDDVIALWNNTQTALATATRQNEEMAKEAASAAQIGDALRECATRLLGMVKADKVSFADFGHREATTINLWQLVEMSRELRTPGSTKWGTKDAQDHYESVRRKLSAALAMVEAMRGALNAVADLRTKYPGWSSEDLIDEGEEIVGSALSQVPPTAKGEERP